MSNDLMNFTSLFSQSLCKNPLIVIYDSFLYHQCLQARDSQVEQRTSKTTLSLYYEKLMEYRSQIESLLPQFIRMAESLR